MKILKAISPHGSNGVPGGHSLHSPEARAENNRVGGINGLMVTIAMSVTAFELDQWDVTTFALVAAVIANGLIFMFGPWERLPMQRVAPLCLVNPALVTIAAYHFGSPYVLLALYADLVALADIYWYSKRWLTLNVGLVLGAFVVGSLTIDGGRPELLALAALPMLISALTVGALSNSFLHSMMVRKRFSSTVTSLLEALHARDGYTGEHSEVTLAMARAVADELELCDKDRKELADVALLHDIGKIGIPNAVLQKPGGLDDEEWAIMRRHPEIGESILRDIPEFEGVAKAIRHEHERWDGGGYPDGIGGEEIPMASRIVLACDAYHAMISDRPYRKALPVEIARKELVDNAGSQFDASVVEALLRAIDSGALDDVKFDEDADAPVERGDIAGAAHIDAVAGDALDEALDAVDVDAEIAASPYDEAVDPLTDPHARNASVGTTWLQNVCGISAYMALTGFNWWTALFLVYALSRLGVIYAYRRQGVPKVWALATGLESYIAVPLLAWLLDEPAVLVLLVGVANSTLSMFWHRPVLRSIQIALVLFTFIGLPGLIFSAGGWGLAAFMTRAFPGVTLTVGYFSPRLREMSFDRDRFRSTMRSLLAALRARDGYTGDHSQETLELVLKVGDYMGICAQDRVNLSDAALLHDIGKIGIPDEILHKPGKLDADEWQVMRRHPEIGEQIVRGIPGFESVAKAIRHEHERWDGGGYPDGIAGEEIPVASRIVLVCDAFHAMTSDRPYRAAMPVEEAWDELRRNAGTQFDPQAVAALLAIEGAMLTHEERCEAADVRAVNVA